MFNIMYYMHFNIFNYLLIGFDQYKPHLNVIMLRISRNCYYVGGGACHYLFGITKKNIYLLIIRYYFLRLNIENISINNIFLQ